MLPSNPVNDKILMHSVAGLLDLQWLSFRICFYDMYFLKQSLKYHLLIMYTFFLHQILILYFRTNRCIYIFIYNDDFFNSLYLFIFLYKSTPRVRDHLVFHFMAQTNKQTAVFLNYQQTTSLCHFLH